MVRGAWQTTAHRVAGVGYDLATKPILATTIANSRSQTLYPGKIYFCLTVILLYLIARQSGTVYVCGGGVVKRNEGSKPSRFLSPSVTQGTAHISLAKTSHVSLTSIATKAEERTGVY